MIKSFPVHHNSSCRFTQRGKNRPCFISPHEGLILLYRIPLVRRLSQCGINRPCFIEFPPIIQPAAGDNLFWLYPPVYSPSESLIVLVLYKFPCIFSQWGILFSTKLSKPHLGYQSVDEQFQAGNETLEKNDLIFNFLLLYGLFSYC